MRLLSLIFVLLAVFEISLQRSTPEDDHYVAAVVEYIVNRNEEASIANYEGLIKEAADNNADIVIFPELTLTNSSTSVTIPIHSILKEYPVPALYSEMYDHQLVAMSAAARQNAIYLVINVQESLNCSRSQLGEECPENKQYYFNTNVVFDRTGAVIDRYRKINLFGEASRTPALHPDLGIFTTDFGVTFGHFICFDLMFQVPAIQVVQKNNIKDVIFPTMWFSEMPYLTAVEIQEAYAYTLDINFLASGANNVNVGSAGSGIYSGKTGALVSTMPGVPTTRLLVAKVPKVPGMVTENYPGPIYDNPTDHDSLVLIQDPSLAAHVTRPLVQGYQEFTLVDKDVSCSFRVRLSHRSNTSVQYRALVQDGTHTYAKREIGIASCLVVACKTHEASTCPYRFNSLEESIIEELEIEMKTYAPQYNKTLSCDNIQYFPQYRYRAAAFSGVRSFSGVSTGGSRNCAVFACTGDTKDTCGRRFPNYENDTTAIFEELSIVSVVPTPIVVPAVEADDSIVFPVSLTVSIMPLEAKDYTYFKYTNNTSTVHTLTLKNTSAELYNFALWGREFSTDGEDAHPPVDDSASVQILSRTLIMSVISVFIYNQF